MALLGKMNLNFNLLVKLKTVIIPSLTMITLLVIRQLGGLQPLELVAFDNMVRSRPQADPDPRLLIVEITESDLQFLKQWPVSDGILAQVLVTLQRHKPRVIGIDLFRDLAIPPGHEALVQQLQKPNIIGITFVENDAMMTVPPPPTLPSERIGFINIPVDPDGVVRRQFMFTSGLTSFPVQLALAYLKPQGIKPKLTVNQDYQLGNVIFRKLESNSGGYQKINAGGYKLLLNYRSPNNLAYTVTLTEVLNNKIHPQRVEDKIVLIGTNALSMKDYFLTPYSSTQIRLRQMPGVIIHGQMVSEILSAVLDKKPLFRFWSEPIEILWMLIWAILGGYWGLKFKKTSVLIGGSLLILSGLGAISYGLFLQMIWVPVAAPMLGFILIFTGMVIVQIWESQQQQYMVMKLLGQQTSSEIAKALWKERSYLINSGILPPKTLTATILFTDFKNFSAIAEKQSSESLMIWLNQYLSAMTDIVLKHQGIVSKFTGDGLMAAFGVPVPRTSVDAIAKDAENAINSALEMGQQLQQLNKQWQQKGLPSVGMRVGIYTGTVTVGSLGGKNRLEYGVIGDSVNIASRLESCEKHREGGICRILIAEETLSYLKGRFEVESWGELSLKGKAIPVTVYRVLGKIKKM